MSDHPLSYAQLLDVALMCNGHDANKIMDMRTGTAKTLGLLAPAAAPTSAENGAGNVNGTVKYRVRWKDSSLGSYSLPSAELSVTTSSKTIRVTKPATNETRATHWILERTLDGKNVFFPINEYSTATLDGTAIATTTYDDNFADSSIRNRVIYRNNQGQPDPFRFCWTNGNVMFGAGGRIHQPSCSLANGATAVTSTDGDFTANMVGEDFSFDADTDGVTYKIATYTNVNSIAIATAYAGTTKSAQPATIAGVRNLVSWCNPGEPDHWGSVEVGGFSNSTLVGSDGDSLEAGIGMGPAGCLLCAANHMWIWTYRVNPAPAVAGGDGTIIPLRARRGAFGPRSVIKFTDKVYGMDQYGVWVLSAGGEPQEIGNEIASDWRALDMSQRNKFWIGPDPLRRQLTFWVCESGDTYPTLGFVYDLTKRKWVGTKDSDYAAATCGVAVPDANLALRLGYFTAAVGSAKSYFWFDEVGTTLGAPPTATKTGTIDGSPDSTSITDSTATFPTTGEGCDGVPVTLVRAADGSEETQVVVSNTGTDLTTTTFTGTAPVVGDTYHLGPINAIWKTGRLHFGDASRKKHVRGLWLWIKHDTSAIDLKLRAYYDGSTTAATYGLDRDEDGVAVTSGSAPATIDPGKTNTQGNNVHRYWVDCPGDKWCNDIQFEFYSIASGDAWEIMEVKVDVDFDMSEFPRKD